MRLPIWSSLLLTASLAGRVMAGFMSVDVSPANQCGNATVTWSGDDGPWHLLLTPTDIVEHGYNLWVQEIPANATNWTIPIRQPVGMTFLVTMWGQSGIRYAGTTDVLQVLSPSSGVASNTSCYMSDQDILNLYTFSFNITSDNNAWPPQCSNLTMNWPSSLESPITPKIVPNASRSSVTTSMMSTSLSAPGVTLTTSGDGSVPTTTSPARRGWLYNKHPEEREDEWYSPAQYLQEPTLMDIAQRQDRMDDTSSSDRTNGNTTKPPTMFGIIPLGNSFEIPITFSEKAAFAYKLPESVISDNPTTWTRQGVTNMNWTIPLSKGTRFILVAGIGDDQQWASGGSSRMMTVGQGTDTCGWPDSGSGLSDEPSATASSTATASNAPGTEGTESGPSLSTIGTIIACVLSVLATLVLVGVCFCCCRIRRRRRAAAGLTAFRDTKPIKRTGSEGDLPLDILGTQIGGEQHYTPHQLAPLDTSMAGLRNTGTGSERGIAAGPVSGESDTESKTPTSADPFRDTPLHERYRGFSRMDSNGPMSASPTVFTAGGFAPGMGGGTGSGSTPGSSTGGTFNQAPAKQGTFSSFGMGRHASQEARLQSSLSSPTHAHSPLSPMTAAGAGTYAQGSVGSAHSRMRPSALRHETAEAEDVSELKRDTLAYLGAEQGSSRSRDRATTPRPGQIVSRGREEDEDGEMEYVVHRDAGRRVMELPPRYEELNWDEGGRPAGQGQEQMQASPPVAMSAGSITPTRRQGAESTTTTSPVHRLHPPGLPAHSVPLPPSPTVPSGSQVQTSGSGALRDGPVPQSPVSSRGHSDGKGGPIP